MEIRGEKIGESKPWVAKITGLDPKYGLAREFIPGIRDYSGSNSVGSRGIRTVWVITEPGIYEYCLPQSWKRTDRDFVEVTEDDVDGVSIDKVDIIKRFQEVQR